MQPVAGRVFGDDDAELVALAREVGVAARATGLMIATAESCTGGGVAAAITAIAGSSEWFDRGFVTYSNEAKFELLGVDPAVLAAHGAVSEATAIEMTRGALARSRAAVAVAVTGVAGPSGGSAAKPVGTVCFGCGKAGAIDACTRRFAGDRAAVRRQSVAEALRLLVAALQRDGTIG